MAQEIVNNGRHLDERIAPLVLDLDKLHVNAVSAKMTETHGWMSFLHESQVEAVLDAAIHFYPDQENEILALHPDKSRNWLTGNRVSKRPCDCPVVHIDLLHGVGIPVSLLGDFAGKLHAHHRGNSQDSSASAQVEELEAMLSSSVSQE